MPKLPGLPFVRSGITAGLSANEAFRRYQAAAAEATAETGEQWTASRRTNFLQLYSQTRQVRSQTVAAMNAPRNVPGGGLDIPDRQTVRATGFGNWAVSFVRPVNSTDVERWYYYQRSNEPLTPAQVEALVLADIEAAQQEEHGTATGMVIEGITYTGTERLIPTEGL